MYAYIAAGVFNERKRKISTEVAHVTRDSDTHFQGQRSTCRGTGAYCGGIPHSLFFMKHVEAAWLSTPLDN